jgi:membrane protease YdiL (CAAX protease family)
MDLHQEPPLDSGSISPPGTPANTSLGVPPRGHPVLAWIVIIAVVGFVALAPFFVQEDRLSQTADSISAVTDVGQARFNLGLRKLGTESPQEEIKLLNKLNSGPVDRRFRYIVLAGEVKGARQASEALDDLHETLAAGHVTLNQQQSRIDDILDRLYRDYSRRRLDAPSLSDADRKYLREHMGWFGQLALAPAGGPQSDAREQLLAAAQRSAIVISVVIIFGLLAGFVGFAALVTFVIFASTGMAHSKLGPRSIFGGIYAETFALWMALYVAISLALSVIPFNTTLLKESKLFLQGLAMLASLVVLAWPVIRGVPWKQVRGDIGWTGGKLGWLEPFIGVVSYPAVVAPLVAALLVVLLIVSLMALGQPAVDPHNDFSVEHMTAHPIVGLFNKSTPWLLVQMLLVASVVAPIVEETVFRGLLYRHLRDATYAAASFGSSVASATISSFVFAIVHPQGVAAVPPLMVLAFMLCLLREWRGTLLPSMMLHAVNNAAVFTVFYFMMA